MPDVRREVKHVACRRNLFFAFDEEPHAAALDDGHLFVWMVVFRSDEIRLEAKPADHHSVADKHLALDAFRRMVDRNVGPVQMASKVETVAITIAVPVVFRRGVRHSPLLYFLSLTASRPDPPAAYSGCTLTTP